MFEVVHDPQVHEGAPRFDDRFAIDLDIDATADEVVFSKPPLELAARTRSGRAPRGARRSGPERHGDRAGSTS